MDIQRETALKYQGLFNLMAKEHGLILEQSEMDEIIKEAMAVVKLFNTTAVSNLLCGSFEPDNKTSSATKCKCGREKWEHPKAT